MNRLQEQFILWQIRKGKIAAFSVIYERYYEAIGRYTRFRISRREDAEDVADQVFLKCLEYLKDPDRKEIEHIQAFLYTLARNAVADYYGSRQHSREVSVADPSVHERPAKFQDGTEENDDEYTDRRAAFVELLQRSLQDLKPEYREVILMRYHDSMTIEQIAEVLNKSEGTVRVLLHRAREAIKKKTQS